MAINIQNESEYIASLIAEHKQPPPGYVQSLYGNLDEIFELLSKMDVSISDNWDWLHEHGFLVDDVI